jgi:carbamoylphosphate synthase large subunit
MYDIENNNQFEGCAIVKKNGWLIYNGCADSPKFHEIMDMLLASADKNDMALEPVRNNQILATIDNGRSVLKGRLPLASPDFILFWDKDIRLAKHLEKMGYRLFNSAETIEICDDKSLTHEILANNNINMPKTIFSNLVFPHNSEQDNSFIEMLEDELKYPMIV